MASPFSIFRKNQKSLMVVLVIGSMIAFTGDSLFTSGELSWPLLGGLLGLILAMIAGFQFGRPVPYAIGGAIVGALLGVLAPNFTSANGAIESELGNYDEERVTELIAKRTVANQFVGEVQRRAFGINFGQSPFQLVYSNPTQDVIVGDMLRAEADSMGIAIDDEAVNAFINEQTGKRLASKDFVAVRKQVTINNQPISEEQLYDLLRDAIKAKVALQTLVPFRDTDSVTPDKYWDLYRRMNVRQQVAFAPINIDDFLDSVGEPSDAEVKTLFEKYQDKVPNLEPGSPGFYQQRKMKLAYVEADYATVEAGIPDSTDEEIQKFYDDNKDIRFREATLPEDPEDDPLDLNLKTLEELEKEAAGESPLPETPEVGEDKPEPAAEVTEENKEEAAGTEDEKEDGGCWQDETEQSVAPAEPAAAQDTTPAAPSLTIPENANQAPLGADPFAEPPAQYIPLDAALRDEISQALKQDKTVARINELMAKTVAEMKRLASARDDREVARITGGDPKTTGMSDVEICKALKDFAGANGLAYAETPVATGIELLDREEFPIGSATAPATQFSARQPNVVQTLFAGGSGAPMFIPARAELNAFEFGNSTTNQFAYWAIAEIPAHPPKLDEEGIREQVVKAWKREKARPIAKERAEAIAAKVTAELAEEKTMSDILEEVTPSGTSDTAKLVVTESLPFSWIRTSSAASPNGSQQASLTQIDGVNGITNDFMSYIFNDLKPNEVGVFDNGDKSIYYVVQPLNRFPSDEADEEAARERFLTTKHFEFNSPMPGLVRQEFGERNLTWLRKLEAKYGLSDWGG